MLNHNVFTILFIFLSIVFNAQNRNFSFQHYSTEDGLSNSNIFAIKQSNNHLMYIATENGVYHFDGYNFNKIKPNTAVKSSYTRNIQFDKNNNLLVINRREGIYEYNSIANDIKLLPELNFKNAVDELLYDDDYYYALNEQISVDAYSIKNKTMIEDAVKQKDKLNQAFAILKTFDNKILVGRTDGLYEFKNGLQQKIKLKTNFSVYAIAQDADSVLYLGTDKEIVCLKIIQ